MKTNDRSSSLQGDDECERCGHTVSATADSCPSCGIEFEDIPQQDRDTILTNDAPKASRRSLVLAVLASVILIVLLLWAIGIIKIPGQESLYQRHGGAYGTLPGPGSK